MYVFMDMETYEETRLEPDDFTKFLIEGHNCAVLSWNGKVIGVELPLTVELEVGGACRVAGWTLCGFRLLGFRAQSLGMRGCRVDVVGLQVVRVQGSGLGGAGLQGGRCGASGC